MKKISGAQKVLMIRPYFFGYNAETASSNTFQYKAENSDTERLALTESDKVIRALTDAGVQVESFDNTLSESPDALFPNNWFSTHPSGIWITYPMAAVNRRAERRADITKWLSERYPIHFDLSSHETSNNYLEGTGSLLIDHNNKHVFAALSVRTNEMLVNIWAAKMNMEVRCFTTSFQGVPVYHTNVILALLADGISILCEEVITNHSPLNILSERGPVILIRKNAMAKLAANCIALNSDNNYPVLLIGSSGWNALSAVDKRLLESAHTILPVDIPTIEAIGGGGVRCMVAELF